MDADAWVRLSNIYRSLSSHDSHQLKALSYGDRSQLDEIAVKKFTELGLIAGKGNSVALTFDGHRIVNWYESR